MTCGNFFKAVRVGFPGEGGFLDHFLHDDDGSIEKLIAFLSVSRGFIVALDGLSDGEIQRVKNAEARCGRPLFASRRQRRERRSSAQLFASRARRFAR